MNRYALLAICLICVALLHPTPGHAQPAPPLPPRPEPHTALRFRPLTTDDGLPSSRVDALAEDALGFMWIGTADGLVRYDGYETLVFRHTADAGALSANAVSALLSAPDGALWVGTRDGGLNRLDPQTQRFSAYHHTAAAPDGIADGPVVALAQQPDGKLWLAVGQRLLRLDPASGAFQRYDLPECGGASPIRALHVTADQTLWVARGGLLALDPASAVARCFLPSRPASTPPPDIAALTQAADGNLWLADQGALLRFTPADARWSAFPLAAPPPPQPPPGPPPALGPLITALQFDPNGLLWVGTVVNGLLLVDPASGQVIGRYASEPTNPDSLSRGPVTHLALSRAGKLWIGTGTSGVSTLDLWQTRLSNYRGGRNDDLRQGWPPPPAPPQIAGTGLLDRPIRALAAQDGAIWLGAAHYLTRFDPASGSYTHLNPLRQPRPNADPVAVDIAGIVPDAAGGLWFDGTDGLTWLDTQRMTFQVYRPADVRGPFIIWALAADQRGALWLTVLNDRTLRRFDRVTHTFAAVPLPPDWPQTEARTLAVAPDGTVWIAGRAALAAYDQRTSEFRVYTPDTFNDLPPTQISAIAFDQAGALWLATDAGLVRVDPSSRHVERFAELDPLIGGVARSVVLDQTGAVWVSGVRGLARLDAQTRATQSFSRADGLPGSEFTAGAASRAADGRLLFAGDGGLTVVRPEHVVPRPDPSRVLLTELQILNEPQQPAAGLLTRPIWQTDAITLPHDRNIVTIDFAAPGVATSERERYRFMLAGLEQEWRVVSGNQRSATYAGLLPGTYTFRVQRATDGDLWDPAETALRVTVLAPWWQTWWARVLGASAVVGLVLLALRLRVRAIERHNQQLEALVNIRTSALRAEVREREHAEAALRAMYQEVERLAVSDDLTRLANRRRFNAYLDEQWGEQPRAGISLLLCDVDWFKRYNDGYGHQAGDSCLQQVAQALLSASMGTGALVARYGGEEFAIVLPGVALDQAVALATNLRAELAHRQLPHRFSATCGVVTLSIGAASTADGGYQSSAELIAAADTALYQAKQAGRDQVVAAQHDCAVALH